MDDRDEFGPGIQKPAELVHVELAGVVDGDDADGRARLLGRDLPGDNVGVVLERGENDLVALTEEPRPKLEATRLIASVVPRVKMISRECGALRNFATFSRASS